MKNLIYSSLLLVIFSITLSVPALAQEKQSDATWEETVEFINKNVSELSTYKRTLNVLGLNIDYSLKFQKGEINRYTDYNLLWRGKDGDVSVKINIPLYKLKKVTTYSTRLMLYTVGKDVKINIAKGSRDDREDISGVEFYVDDSEMRPRLLKAFQHLAYLATEYREEQRKASGDAF